MNLFFFLVLLIIGGLQALQGAINNAGSKWIGTSEMIFGLSLVQSLPPLLLILARKPTFNISQFILQGYKWYLFSGIIGIIAIAVVSFSISRVGVLPVFILVILGQIVGSAILDQIGLFGTPKVPITLPRIVSIIFIVLGVILLIITGADQNISQSTTH